MDRELKKAVKRILLLDTILSLSSSFYSNVNEIGDGLEEIFEAASIKKKKLKDVFSEEEEIK